MDTHAPPNIEHVAPLSPGQERLLEAEYGGDEQLWPSGEASARMRPVDVAAVDVEGPLDLGCMDRAVDALIERQTALRTTFRFRPGAAPVQVVSATRPHATAFGQLPGSSNDPLPLEGLLAAAQRRTFSPTDPDLFMAQVLEVTAERHVILLHIHHLISDGWSIGLLYRELSALYKAIKEDTPSSLPRLPCTFGDRCARIRTERSSGRFAQQLRYWRVELAGPSPTIFTPTLDADQNRTPVNDEPLFFGRGLVEQLRVAGRRATTPGGLAGAMLTALAVAINAHTGARDIRIGTMAAGRTREAAEHLIGNLVNIVTIRIALEPDEPLDALLSRVNGKVAAALDNQDIPIQDVRQALAQDLRAQPPYEVTFALNTMKVGSLALPGLTSHDLGISTTGESTGPRVAPTGIVLRWVIVESEGDLAGSVTYDMRRFAKHDVRSLIATFERLLHKIASRSADAL